MDLSKYTVNDRGYTVVPCIPLTEENMSDDLIGMAVTLGLAEAGTISSSGVIEGYDSTHIHVKIGGKSKKFEYDPEDIQLQVYQFDKGILFSNEKPKYKEQDVPKEVKKEVKKKVVKSTAKKPRKKSSKKEETQPKASKPSYTPKYGIEWS